MTAAARRLLLIVAVLAAAAAPSPAEAQDGAAIRLDAGRFTVVSYPQDERLARSLLAAAQANDTFPGLPRPGARALIAIAPDERRFRQWIGGHAPEWGAAVAFPGEVPGRIVMQGRRAGSDAGDPIEVLRHELAHLALHERLGDLPPRWFDEGYASYAAGEWGRDELLATNAALVLRGMPSLDSLDAGFSAGSSRAEASYALAHRAVAELAGIDAERGLALFFEEWRRTSSLERALRSAYGITYAGFEKRWQERTRRRFGVLAVAADFSLAVSLVLLFLLPFYVARRRRDRERMAALVAADEAAERAARESAIEELLRSIPPSPPAPPSSSSGPHGNGGSAGPR